MNMDDYCDSEEHIYENIVSTSRYKYNKILYGIINSFSLKKREKFPTPTSSPTIHRSFYDDNITAMNSCEFYDNSYASCEDDNIYENLEFFDAYDDSNFLHTDSALDNWMRNLAYDIDDYETDNYIFIKSIPSVLQANCVISHHNQHVSKSEITLNFLKSLWSEDRVGMMSFLLETFSSLLRMQSQVPTSINTLTELQEIKKSPKKLSTSRSKRQRKRDIYRKLILSSSLNSLMITYNRPLKCYFALSLCEAFSSRLPSQSSDLKIILAIKQSFRLKFSSKNHKKEFYRTLKFILANFSSSAVVKIRENREELYEPIWTCQSCQSSTNKRSAMVISENIYAQLMTPTDDSEWEIDDEFSFVVNGDAMMTTEKLSPSAFTSVVILYSDENSELNKIIYDRESHTKSLSKSTNSGSELVEQLASEHKTIIVESSSENMTIDEKYFAPAEAWKKLIQMPSYMEDEEDILIDVSILKEKLSSSNTSSYNNINESFPIGQLSKSTSIYDDATSFQFGENFSFAKSIESFKSANLVDGYETNYSSKSPISSPRKDRFRDRLASKLGLKSSRTVNISDQSLNESTKSSDDEQAERHIIFGCNLELVEKDGYYKQIPKFIVECVKFLEIESNLKTAGIYRVSGNKTLMDSLRKKLNEKRQPKKEKESKYICLQEQDVHTLTGLLKMFFRELYPPVMPKDVFTACTSEKLSASQMREKLADMPEVNYSLLKYLFKHFKSIERYEKENLMSSGNIAICWGLGLFASGKELELSPFDNDIAKCNMLCKFLIDNYREVFEL